MFCALLLLLPIVTVYPLAKDVPSLTYCLFVVAVSKILRNGSDGDEGTPYFDNSIYEAEVDENEQLDHPVLTVSAHTPNNCKYLSIKYLIHTHCILMKVPILQVRSVWDKLILTYYNNNLNLHSFIIKRE